MIKLNKIYSKESEKEFPNENKDSYLMRRGFDAATKYYKEEVKYLNNRIDNLKKIVKLNEDAVKELIMCLKNK